MRRAFKRLVAVEVLCELVELLGRFCGRMEPVGAVRRGKALVHDLDVLVFVRARAFDYVDALSIRRTLLMPPIMDAVFREEFHLVPCDDQRRILLVHGRTGLPVELHLVTNMAEWWERYVLFTGSPGWLNKMRKAVRKNVYCYHDDGRIERSPGKFARPSSEKGIFQTLRIPEVPPARRE